MWEIQIFQRQGKKLHLIVSKREMKIASGALFQPPRKIDLWYLWDTYIMCAMY